ncbi:MAG TPA: DUF1684 domain-containing protein [Polyangia bacterium]
MPSPVTAVRVDAHATCPLPPPQNRLPIAIETGEMDGRH